MCIHTIYDDVVGMTSLAPTYSIVFYEDILFDIHPLSQGQNQSILFFTHNANWCNELNTYLLDPQGICRISKRNTLINPTKKCGTLLHPCLVSVEPQW